MTGLVEFVEARIAEDEAAANATMFRDGWSAVRDEGSLEWWVADASVGAMYSTGYVGNGDSEPAAEHIARWDPARVLAECAAKRRIIAETLRWRHTVSEDCWYTCPAATEEREGQECCNDATRGGPCDCGLDTQVSNLLLALAAPYASHPDCVAADLGVPR